LAIKRRVHPIECYPISDSDWSSERFEKLLNERLGPHERIIEIRWPRDQSSSGKAWIITESLVMGPAA
jgi:hypothetical protein